MDNVVTRFDADFSFVKKTGALPTVEVDLNSLEVAGIESYTDEICNALHGFLLSSKPVTIYLLETPSFNFGYSGLSAFIGIGGSDAVLKEVYDHFSGISNVKARFSEYIPIAKATKALHIEFENIWMPYEEGTWHSVLSAVQLELDTTSEEDILSDPMENIDFDDFETAIGISEVKNAIRPLRIRAARKDASIGSIRKTIEDVFGLPKGSVQLCGPDRVALRSDALIKTLRRRWKD